MAKQTRLRRGTAAEQAAFAGAIGEVSVNTTDNRLAVHNGSKLGGFPAIHENGNKGLDLTLTGNANLTAKNITLKDSSLDSSLSISSSGIRMRDGNVERIVINGSDYKINDWNGFPFIDAYYRKITEDNGDTILDFISKNIIYDFNPVLNWSIQALYSANGSVSIGWNERQCYNADSVITLDWNNNTLWRNFNGSSQIALNWSGCELNDKAGIKSADWNNRRLIKSDGSTVTIDWENSQLKSTSINYYDWQNEYFYHNGYLVGDIGGNALFDSDDGTYSLDWAFRQLWDNSTLGNKKSLDWNNRLLFTTGGTNLSLDWSNRILSGTWTAQNLVVPNSINTVNRICLDSNNIPSFDWHNRVLFDFEFQPSIIWGTNFISNNYRYLLKSGGQVTVDWENRILSGTWTAENLVVPSSLNSNTRNLIDNNNRIVLDWNNKNLTNGTITNDVSIDWKNSYLQAKSFITTYYPTLDWSGKLLYDSTVTISEDWGNRKLYDNDGSTVTLDWKNRILSGNWTSQKLTANTGIFNNKVGIGLSSPNYQLDVLGTGGFQSIIITGFSNAPATSTSPGIKGQIAASGGFFFCATGINQWGRVALTNW